MPGVSRETGSRGSTKFIVPVATAGGGHKRRINNLSCTAVCGVRDTDVGNNRRKIPALLKLLIL